MQERACVILVVWLLGACVGGHQVFFNQSNSYLCYSSVGGCLWTDSSIWHNNTNPIDSDDVYITTDSTVALLILINNLQLNLSRLVLEGNLTLRVTEQSIAVRNLIIGSVAKMEAKLNGSIVCGEATVDGGIVLYNTSSLSVSSMLLLDGFAFLSAQDFSMLIL
jgi:hypothetical protein